VDSVAIEDFAEEWVPTLCSSSEFYRLLPLLLLLDDRNVAVGVEQLAAVTGKSVEKVSARCSSYPVPSGTRLAGC